LGKKEEETEYIQKKFNEFKEILKELTIMINFCPHEAFTVLTKVLKHKWTYLLRISDFLQQSADELMIPIREILRYTTSKPIDNETFKIALLLVIYGGISLQNVSRCFFSQGEIFRSATAHLTKAILGKTDFKLQEHLGTYKKSIEKLKIMINNRCIKRYSMIIETNLTIKMERNLRSGYWLLLYPSYLNREVMSQVEFCNVIHIRLGKNPTNLNGTCVCGAKCDYYYAMACMKGGVVVQRHDTIRDKLAYLTRLGFLIITSKLKI